LSVNTPTVLPKHISETTYDEVSENSLSLEKCRVEVTCGIQLVKTGKEGVLRIRKQDLQVGGFVGHGALGLVGEEEPFVAFGVDEEGHFGEVAGCKFTGGEVADLWAVRLESGQWLG